MDIKFTRLTEVSSTAIIELMNHPLVRRQMPLLTDTFTEKDYTDFILKKEELWSDYGYGPWAFTIQERFIGWGGLQPENTNTEIALVLHPDFWGYGNEIYKRIIDYAFNDLCLTSIILLFPTTRTNVNGLSRLGFKQESIIIIEGLEFIRYRIMNRRKDTFL